MILIIEDNEDIREDLAELLTLDGFKVITADGGAEAIQMAEIYVPDLVICDIMMPGMDGYEVMAAFRKNEKSRGIPFIFSSSKSEKKDEQKAKAFGVAYYLVKPFDEAEVLRCIHDCLQKQSDNGPAAKV